MSRPPIPDFPDFPDFLTAAEAADILRLKPFEVSKLCKEGKIKAEKPGLRYLIDPAELAAYIYGGSNDMDAA